MRQPFRLPTILPGLSLPGLSLPGLSLPSLSLPSSLLLGLLFLAAPAPATAQDLPLVTGVEAQPLAAQVRRLTAALEHVGAPLDAKRAAALERALAGEDAGALLLEVQRLLDPLVLASVQVSAESRVKVEPGPAARELVQNGWRVFLVKVTNEAGVTSPLRCSSPNAVPPYQRSTNVAEPEVSVSEAAVRDRWLELDTFDQRPMNATLSGLGLEYRLLLLYSRDAGQREAKLEFDVGQGTQDLGFRSEVSLLFECARAVPVTLRVLDVDGSPTTGQFVFHDSEGRVVPARARRLAPDFFFHDQIYRSDGQTVLLSPGEYQVQWSRGPEYKDLARSILVPEAETHEETFQLERWIDAAALGWVSGDHHVHAAGCAHYESPSQGVGPEDMLLHILGEDLKVGCVLSWGPCWYFQKQFFDGKVHALSTATTLLRYDVEVSGFPSSHAGHLCLLRLTEDDYPGTTRIEEWPSWDLPVLAWGKSQGAVVGFSHSGWGLQVSGDQLPTLEVPRFDGIGANEYVVDVVHGVCDFISAVDTPAIWELNIWYHTLNCGYTARISGETDFPCIYGERVGLGRSYVRMEPGPLDYDEWVFGLRDGASYVGDGRSHLIDFSVGGLEVGRPGADGRASVLATVKGQTLRVSVKAAAWLDEQPRPGISSRPMDQKPYWHVERARIGTSRKVAVELVVNGHAVQRKEIPADGSLVDVEFSFEPKISSWVALRIFPSSHTNPVFVEVDGRPIRASKSSAEWCAKAVEVCWNSKQGAIRESERAAARAAYDVAAEAYKSIAGEAEGE